MAKRRVDIELEEEVLRWAAIEAAKVGISRRQYLSRIITRKYHEVNTGIKFIDEAGLSIGYKPNPAFNEKIFSENKPE